MTQQPLSTLDWPAYRQTLAETGFVVLPPLLSADECHELAGLYSAPGLYRKTIVMQQHGYGSGEYKYFNYPLPPAIDRLRHALFGQLALVANDWNEKLGFAQRYPADLDEWLATCHEAGQTRPTPLILTYGAGSWNALHQDIYGDLYFPFQAVLFLNQPGQDFNGGEFVILEQRPPDAIESDCSTTRAGTNIAIHDPIPSGKRVKRVLSDKYETRGQRSTAGQPHDGRAYFSRCSLIVNHT